MSLKMRLCNLTPRGLESWTGACFWTDLVGIAENNAEVAAAIASSAEEVRTSQSSFCESFGSSREYVLVGTESPRKDLHGSPASIRSSLGSFGGVSANLLDGNSAESLKEQC